MTSIYVSYTRRDAEFAADLTKGLIEAGYQLPMNPMQIAGGVTWRKALTEALSDADVFISLLSKNSIQSQYPMMELGAARAISGSREEKLILPIAIDDIDIPIAIQDIQILFANGRNPQQMLPEISLAISAFERRKEAAKAEQEAVKEVVQQNLAHFVNDAIESQENLRKANKKSAENWYRVGFGMLVLGISVGLLSALRLSSSEDASDDLSRVFTLIALEIVIIGFLAALAKYSYSLGKSYMSESLKASDRIHAILFGKFYLQAFGHKATPADVRDVFQHWNIDRASTFSAMDTNEIDPQILASISQLFASIRELRAKRG